MRYRLIFFMGALALAQATVDDANMANADFAPAGEVVRAATEAGSSEHLVPVSSAEVEAELDARAYPTSFSPIPTDNAGYAAMANSAHSRYCKTAAKTAYGYSRACIDNYWPSIFERTVAPEDQAAVATPAIEVDATATITDSGVSITTVPTSDPTTFAIATRSRTAEELVQEELAAQLLAEIVISRRHEDGAHPMFAGRHGGNGTARDGGDKVGNRAQEPRVQQKRGLLDRLAKLLANLPVPGKKKDQ